MSSFRGLLGTETTSLVPPEPAHAVFASFGSGLALIFALLVAAGACFGCGAKTGVDVPDAGPEEPEPDAGPPPVVSRCIEVPPGAGVVRADFTAPVSLAVVDVFFLIDATASMVDEIDNVRERLADIVVPGTRAAIPDAAFGLAFVGEFPVEPHGPPSVRPYELRSVITDDVTQVEAQLESIPEWGNFDDAEAQVEALYQVATGAGLAPWIDPSFGCSRGGIGGVCFRDDSLPVVVLITDAPMHNGPPRTAPIEPYEFSGPHSYLETVAALNSAGIFVIGLGARDPGRLQPMAHLRALAQDTGAVADGRSMAFDIGSRGDGVGEGIVDAVRTLAERLPLDVDALVQDVPGDAYDARLLVRAVRPLRAEPASGVRELAEDSFLGVTPGTQVTFQLEIDPSAIAPSESTRRVPARILFRAFGRSRLGSQDVVIVLGGVDGGGCDEPDEEERDGTIES